MNQILYTGGNKGKRGTTDLQKIIIFFVIFIIVFAICLISVGGNLLSKVKNNKEPQNNTVGDPNENNIPTEPVIQSKIDIEFSSVQDGVALKVTSELELETVKYWWDEEEPITYRAESEETEYETTIKTKQGTHTLKVEVTDSNGHIETKEQLVIGDAVPELTISTDRVSNYIIKAKDEEVSLSKIVITLNGETQEIEIDDKEFEQLVPIPEGNSLIEVTVYNENNLSTTKKAKIVGFKK